MNGLQQALLDPPAPPLSHDGFFWCGHCHHIVTLSAQQEETWLNAPAASRAEIKCPRCHKWDVLWRTPSVRRPKSSPLPVDDARAHALFSNIYQLIGCPQPTN